MPRRKSAIIPPAPRKTLLEWIEANDSATTDCAPPACTPEICAFHARIAIAPETAGFEGPEPLQPPPGLRLPPLG